MGVFKNDVGRPSNKTIMIKTFLKVMGLIVIIAIAFGIGYYFNDKQNKNDSKSGSNNSNNSNKNKTTTTAKNTSNKFDKEQVTLKLNKNDDFPEDVYDIYVYGKKIPNIMASNIENIDVIDDIAIIDLSYIDSNYLLVVNTKGEQLMITDGDMEYCSNYKSSECYGYKVKGNSFTYYLDDLGNDGAIKCSNDNVVLSEIQVTYKNGKLYSKTLSSITGEEYKKSHNVDCYDAE